VVVVAVAAAAAYYKLVYVPANTAIVTPMQTAVVHEGSLILSASGSGTLVAKDEVDLSFESGGKVTEVGVKVGDQVKQGDLLAKIDDTDLQTAYTEAKRALDELTSSSAVLDAEAAVATAQSDLDEAIQHLEYIISPTVYYWENQVRARQTALDDAKAAAAASPTDAAAQAAVDKADASLKSAQASLASAQYSYENTYVRQNFVYYVMDALTHKKVRYETEPSDADIAEARAALAAAQASLDQANTYYAALTGGDVPEDATGSSLTKLEQAKAAAENAKEALDAASLTATISGTVMAVNISAGETAKSGATAITISDLSTPYLEVFLDESDWSNVKAGDEADITFDILPDDTFTGTVTQVDPGLYSQNMQTVVRAYVQLSEKDAAALDLPLGTSATVEIINAKVENAVLVSVDALHTTDTGEYTVFVLENGTPTLRAVEIGIQDLLNAEVKSGLKAGDVVTTGTTKATTTK
jgi:HlyD family secretion protein